MVLKYILTMLTRDERLIQTLADSRIIRRAAQMAAYFLHRGPERFKNFKNVFEKELKDGMKEIESKHKRRES